MLVKEGVFASRSDAVRQGLEVLVEDERRRRTAQAIVRGYQEAPQTAQEVGWSNEATIGMIGDEPW